MHGGVLCDQVQQEAEGDVEDEGSVVRVEQQEEGVGDEDDAQPATAEAAAPAEEDTEKEDGGISFQKLVGVADEVEEEEEAGLDEEEEDEEMGVEADLLTHPCIRELLLLLLTALQYSDTDWRATAELVREIIR